MGLNNTDYDGLLSAPSRTKRIITLIISFVLFWANFGIFILSAIVDIRMGRITDGLAVTVFFFFWLSCRVLRFIVQLFLSRARPTQES